MANKNIPKESDDIVRRKIRLVRRFQSSACWQDINCEPKEFTDPKN
jgi:uncharacterized protein (UPF0303 family)